MASGDDASSPNHPIFHDALGEGPAREVEMVFITVPAGAGNEFHRHPGDQWTAVQQGEVTFTIKGQPPVVLRAGEGNYVPRGIIHRQQNFSDKPARYVVINILDKGRPVAEPVP